MNLAFPIGLAALASVLLPLLIHLARRTEQRPTDFAALRWLRQKPRPRHRPRFDERALLAARLLLLALAALVLAQPMRVESARAGRVTAILPGADVPPQIAGERRIWLAPGFPAIDTPPPPPVPVPTASLIRQLDAETPAATTLTFVLPRAFDGADAALPAVSRRVGWRIAGAGRPPARAVPPPRPVLLGDAAAPGARYIAAALRASQGSAAAPAPAPAPARATALIRLGGGALPPSLLRQVEAGTTLLVDAATAIPAGPTIAIWSDVRGLPLVERSAVGRGAILRFVRPVKPQAMPDVLEPDFPRHLLALFAGPPAPTRVAAAAYRPVPGAAASAVPPARPIWPWLAVAVAAVYLLERWLATRAGRSATR